MRFIVATALISSGFILLAAVSDASLWIEDVWRVAKKRRLYRRMRREANRG